MSFLLMGSVLECRLDVSIRILHPPAIVRMSEVAIVGKSCWLDLLMNEHVSEMLRLLFQGYIPLHLSKCLRSVSIGHQQMNLYKHSRRSIRTTIERSFEELCVSSDSAVS